MEICILKFSGTHDADKALEEIVNAHADRHSWLHEVGVVTRRDISEQVEQRLHTLESKVLAAQQQQVSP